jgi:hypothetical protein
MVSGIPSIFVVCARSVAAMALNRAPLSAPIPNSTLVGEIRGSHHPQPEARRSTKGDEAQNDTQSDSRGGLPARPASALSCGSGRERTKDVVQVRPPAGAFTVVSSN